MPESKQHGRGHAGSSMHISQNIRERMKGEHSLQVDQSGESFEGHERAAGATIYQHKQEDQPEIHPRQHE